MKYIVYTININGYSYIGYTSKTMSERFMGHKRDKNTTLYFFMKKFSITKLDINNFDLLYFDNILEAQLKEAQLQKELLDKEPSKLINIRIEMSNLRNNNSPVCKESDDSFEAFRLLQKKNRLLEKKNRLLELELLLDLKKYELNDEKFTDIITPKIDNLEKEIQHLGLVIKYLKN